MSNSTQPKWNETSAIRRGQEALHLATTYQVEVVPRLAPLTIEHLTEDLARLSTSAPESG